MEMLNGVISARRAGTKGAWIGECRLYKNDILVDIKGTKQFSGKGAKSEALKAAAKLREQMESTNDED